MSEIRNEVIEDDRSYKLKADLPGVKKQDIVSKSRVLSRIGGAPSPWWGGVDPWLTPPRR